jgi:cobalt-zinc-cadmium efflux system membrane fusion protein
MKTFMLATLATALLLAGCGEKSAPKDHDHGAPAMAAADHHDEVGEKLTHFSDQTELFVEFPALVVGQPASFVAYVTQLADFKPLVQGKLTVVLAGGNAAEERFIVDAPSMPGIFKPGVTPKSAGERELSLIVDSALGTITHELGPVTVFADAKSAAEGHGSHGHDEAGISFSKEQQWKINFATVEAVKGVARSSIAATATIKAHPDGEARLAAPAAGLLRAAGNFPHVGQTVLKGQVLAWLAPRLGGETDQATLDAGAGKAKIALEQARRERERMESLFKDEAVAEKRLLDARASERMAEAEVHSALARQGQFGAAGGVGGIAIRAPIAGTVADVAVAPGAFVNEGAPLFHVANTARLWLEARVPESEVGRLGKPGGAAFSVDGFAQPFVIEAGKNGRLVAVGGVVDVTTRTVPAIFEFANPEGNLRLGMNARAQLYAGDGQPAVLVPASAVQDESGTLAVYVQTGGESFERRIVRTGARDGARIAILDGIEAGQRVVSQGAYLIRLSTSKTGPSGHGH